MRLGLGIGIDKTNIAAISGGLRARFLGTGTQYTQLGPITRQLSAAMTGDGTQTTDLLVTKRFAPNYTGDGTLVASIESFTGILDDYPTAAAAYSIRLLRTDYAGALVKIRRSSDNAEKDFYKDSNNELSLTSEDGSSTTLSSWIGSDNGFIKTWYDQSGSANNATQTSASAQAQIINAGALITQNGKAALTFNGSTTTYSLSSVLNAVNNCSIIGVNAPTATNIFSSIYSGFDDFATFNLLFRYSDDGKIFAGFNGVSAAGNYNSTTSYIAQQNLLFLNFDNSFSAGNQADLFVNGTDFVMTGSNSTGALKSPVNAYIGSRNGANKFNGSMQELIIYASEKLSDRAGIQNNVNDFYTIY